MKSSAVRPLTGLAMIVAVGLIIAFAIGLFQGSFTKTEPVTVISDRAGLVMNNDAKVKMRGVEVGKVDSIESRPDGKAALRLAMNPSQLHLIPSNVNVNIESPTVFGAKFVNLVPPDDPSPQKLRPGQVIQSQHVVVEINTVFQQLVQVLDKIDPAKLNQTLGAISTAFDGRGEKFGKTLTDFNAFLAKIEPSLPNLSRDLEAAAPTLGAYADAAPDLVRTAGSTTQVSHTIVDQQQELDEFSGRLNRFSGYRKRGDRRKRTSAGRCAAPARAHHRAAQPVSRIGELLNWRTCRDGEFATTSR